MWERAKRVMKRAPMPVVAGFVAVLAGVGTAIAADAIDKWGNRSRTLTINGIPFESNSIPVTVLKKKSVKRELYLKKQADRRFLSRADADATFMKPGDASSAFVEGDARILRESKLVGPASTPVLELPGVLRVSATAPTGSGAASVEIHNLATADLHFAASAGPPATIPSNTSTSRTFPLSVPVTSQLALGTGNGAPGYTLTLTAFPAGVDQLQVVAELIAG